jgi:formylglycine-generating enzyme required for sulfatase activity
MFRRCAMVLGVASLVLFAGSARADLFGTGVNQFTIDFVPISGATNPTSGYGIVNHDYRMGTYEVTNDQWNKFKAAYGPVTGSEGGYGVSSYFTGLNQPTDSMNWFAAAQFVNWLNTSTGRQAAYKFTGTQGSNTYTFVPWSSTDLGYDASNPYRNTAAYYFLPNENEWVKAAFWNGTALQTYATKAGDTLFQGNGSNGGWNYYTTHYATTPSGPWIVGSGSQELNGTYDMMGNNMEWMESPYSSGDYGAGSSRGLRGGYWAFDSSYLPSFMRAHHDPTNEVNSLGFRVASVGVPEPGSIVLLVAGGLCLLAYAWRRRRGARAQL